MTEHSYVPWSIASVAEGATTRLVLAGELDASTAEELRAHIEASTEGEVELDLSQVTFVDSSGLAALLQSHQRLARQSRRLVISATSPVVQRVLELAGVAGHLGLDLR